MAVQGAGLTAQGQLPSIGMTDNLNWINALTVLGHFLAHQTRRRCVPKGQASDEIKRTGFPVDEGQSYCVDFVPTAERPRFASLTMAAIEAMEAVGVISELRFAAESNAGDPATVAYDCVQELAARRQGYPFEGGDVDLPRDTDDYISTFEMAIDFAKDEATMTVPDTSLRHSKDFRSVRWFGKYHAFTATQAACVRALWEAWENGTPELSGETVLEVAGAESKRLKDVFGDHSAWETMIVSGSTKGAYRLAKPVAS